MDTEHRKGNDAGDGSLRLRLAAFVAAAILLAARLPQLILAPRLWAEEATVYLAHAVHHTFLQSLLLVPTSRGPAGYFNFAANLPAATAARLLSLEHAPWSTLVVAFLCQLLPLAIVLFGDSIFWRTTRQRLTICALILFTAPVVPEVWLNSINAQIFCGLTALLIVCERLESMPPTRRNVYRAVLVFCALSGPYVAILLPVLWLRTRRAPGRPESRAYLRMVLITTTVQAAAFVAVRVTSAIDIDRLRSASFGDRFLSAVIHHVLRPFVGVLATDDPGLVSSQAWDATVRGPQLLILAAAVVLLAALAAIIVPLVRAHRDSPFCLLPLAFVVWSGATTVLSYGVPTSRYGVLPGLSLLLTVAVVGWQHARRPIRNIVNGLVATAILCGILTDLLPSAHARPSFEGPFWPDQVAAWRQDPDRGILLWPSRDGLGWRVHLAEPARFVRIRQTLNRTRPFHLTSRGDWVEHTIAIPGLPPDFKMIWTAEMTQSSKTADVEVTVTDGAGVRIAARTLDGLIEQHPQRFLIEATSLQKDAGRRWHEATELGFRLRATGRTPVRLLVEELEIAPRIEGLLDPLLERVRLPQRLYAGTARPIDQEATSVAMAASLWHDHDLRWQAQDHAREMARWPAGPRGLRLRPAAQPSEGSPLSGTGLGYAAPRAAAIWAAPFVGLGGESALVVAHLALYAMLMILTYQRLEGPPIGRSIFVAGFFLASAGLGYAFLPQNQALWMTCLFVPLWSWRCGWLEHKPLATAALCGGLLAWIGSGLPGPASIVGLILIADLLAKRTGRAIATLSVLLATAATLWVLLQIPETSLTRERSKHERSIGEQSIGELASGDLGTHDLATARSFRQLPPRSPEAFYRDGDAITKRGPGEWLRDMAAGSGRLLAGRPGGVVLGFPFVLVAFAAAILAPGTASTNGRLTNLSITATASVRRGDLLLLGGLLALSLWAAAGPPSGDVGVLGASRFAIVFPLFALLPPAMPFRPRLLVPLLVVSILLVAPSLAMVWDPVP